MSGKPGWTSPTCCEAQRTARVSKSRDRLHTAARWHRACRGAWPTRPGEQVIRCTCPCHRPAPSVDVAAQLRAEREARAAAFALPKIPPSQGTADTCRHGHRKTAETTGARGECLTCKRAAQRV